MNWLWWAILDDLTAPPALIGIVFGVVALVVVIACGAVRAVGVAAAWIFGRKK